MPTDDQRLKLVLIPFIQNGSSLAEQLNTALSNIKCELSDCRELLIPSFRVEEIQVDGNVGSQMPDKKFVHNSKSKTVFELASGSPPHETLVQPVGSTSKVLRDDFLIGKSPVLLMKA